MEGFEKALEECLPALQRFVRFRISNMEDADDIVQDVCETVVRNSRELRDPAAFRPWLFTIARNRCMDHYRRKTPELTQLEDAEELCAPGDVRSIWETLSGLPAGRDGPLHRRDRRQEL